MSQQPSFLLKALGVIVGIALWAVGAVLLTAWLIVTFGD